VSDHLPLTVRVGESAKQAPCVLFGQHDDVVEALAVEGADQPLCKGVHHRRRTAVRISRMPRHFTRCEKANP